MAKTLTGTIKWFNHFKGFGFITADNIEEDIFAHYSQLKVDGSRTINANQAVTFSIERTSKGLNAIDITPL